MGITRLTKWRSVVAAGFFVGTPKRVDMGRRISRVIVKERKMLFIIDAPV
jgi:hypothetical protein